MKQMFFKLLGKNKHDYIVVLISGSIIIAIIYLTSLFAGCLNLITNGEVGGFEALFETLDFFILSYALFLFMMALVILDYIRKRSYTYALLDVLGIQKKHKYLFVAIEYISISICSILLGIILGKIGAIGLKKALYLLFAEYEGGFDVGSVPLKFTVVIGTLFFGLLFLIYDELIACLGLDVLLSFGKSQGKSLKKSPVLMIISILLIGLALFSQYTYWGKVSKMFPTIVLCVGLFMFLYTAGGFLLLNLQKKKRKYYKKILWLNNWYHRFAYNINISYIISVLLFTIIFIFGVKLIDHYPVDASEDYKYDIVWMANEEDENFLEELVSNYNVKIQTQPCIRVTAIDFGEHMGISETEYKKWTGRSLNLEEDEIFVVYQRDREARNELGISHGALYPKLYIGCANKKLWIVPERADPIPSSDFVKYHIVTGEEDKILTGIYHSDALPKYYGKVWENIIVFSDEYYNSVKDNAEGANLAVMLKVMGNYDEVCRRIYAYAAEHSQINVLDKDLGNLIYETREWMAREEKEKAFELVSNGLSIILLFIAIIIIIFIKQQCDFNELNWKYDFYSHTGMPYKRRKKYIKKEVGLSAQIAILVGMVFSVIFAFVNVILKKLEFSISVYYMICIASIILFLTIILLIVVSIISKMNIIKIERRNRNEHIKR